MKIPTVVLGKIKNKNLVEFAENNSILYLHEVLKICLYCNVKINSIFHDFGMQLLKNDTVKQHENHHSGTWGDAEQ